MGSKHHVSKGVTCLLCSISSDFLCCDWAHIFYHISILYLNRNSMESFICIYFSTNFCSDFHNFEDTVGYLFWEGIGLATELGRTQTPQSLSVLNLDSVKLRLFYLETTRIQDSDFCSFDHLTEILRLPDHETMKLDPLANCSVMKLRNN